MGIYKYEKGYQEKNVFESALERIRYIYDSFDKVVVELSGGKDSTAVLNCALIVAKERNKLPLEVHFYDEEVIHPPTIEYMHRIAKNPDIKLNWWCLEFKHRNACSNDEPFWYCWDKDKKDKWVRPLPTGVEIRTTHPQFRKGMSYQDWCAFIAEREGPRTASLVGIRTQESMRRYKMIIAKKNEPYINGRSEKGIYDYGGKKKKFYKSNKYNCYPIYDWSSDDVWLAVTKFNWDYNKTYDVFNKTRLYGRFLSQRVGPPFGEEPLRTLWIYSECFPEMWHKMLDRVEGVNTAWRYSNTNLFGVKMSNKKPENLTYKDWLPIILDSYDINWQHKVNYSINLIIKNHYSKTNNELPDRSPHPLTGASWHLCCQCAMKGDFKGRTIGKLDSLAIKAREKDGLATMEEAIMKYGKDEFKAKYKLL